MARSMTFQINDGSTGGVNPAVFITITENANGTLSFNVTQEGGVIGDLRGLFFDVNAVADGALAKSLVVSGASAPSTLKTGDDSVKDLGNGANMNGLTSTNGDGGFDAGINIGSAGLGSDDVRSFSFTLGSTARALTLDDFANVDFGVRLTSVGTLGGNRADSSKQIETTSAAIDARDDAATVAENASTSGNVLDNDANQLGSTSLTGLDGGTLGQTLALANAAGATLTVNADGTYALDASAADALSAGETLSYTFHYDVRSASADQISSDSASFVVTVTGTNDGPDAQDDDAGHVAENGATSGSVLDNDSDIDRLDVLSVTGVNGQALDTVVTLASGATVVMHADGSYTYDTNGAFDSLNQGESATDSFQYGISDGQGGTNIATVTVAIDGVGAPPPPAPPPAPVVADHFESWGTGSPVHGLLPDISHITLYWRDDAFLADEKPRGGDDWFTVKFDYSFGATGFPLHNDVDTDLGDLLDVLVSKGAITEDHKNDLVGVAIKGSTMEQWYNSDASSSVQDALPADLSALVQNRALDLAYSWDATQLTWL